MRQITVALLMLVGLALVWALPAVAKDGVKATLTTAVPLDAKPGTQLDVAWKLAYVDEGQRRPFGAGGVFIRLLSRSGAPAQVAFARGDGGGRGEFTAAIVVPRGGIADVQIGLRGFTSGRVSRRPADLLFPITNDPLPGPARVASPRSTPRLAVEDDGPARWPFVAVLAALALGGLCAAAAKRRRPAGA